MKKINKILAICGPTAVGKTSFSIEIAKHFNGEIVSCDSMQLYKYMDIGSAKPSLEELNQVRHHLIGVVEPGEAFSVAKYKEMAAKAIDDISGRGLLPIMAGGTGLYLDALVFDLDFAAPPCDPKIRSELYEIAETKGNEYLHDMLKECDKAAASRIHPNNVRRVVRAIESAKSGVTLSNFSNDLKRSDKYEFVLIGLRRDRQELYDRINRRVDILIKNGLLDEVKRLKEMGLSETDIAMKGIGYKEILAYFEGKYDLEAAIDTIKKNTRHYAKRQLTWLKRYEDMKWFELSESMDEQKSLEEIILWLEKNL
ncbi:MAG: tRNA (adenosine(37)-N6)-dimethylallyltransferase MiaA [Eubacterium sp.]|nr:tRNA (adenosine(37)-N6)-dimethylallyltransferase MiaA [Eubacterium sp.]